MTKKTHEPQTKGEVNPMKKTTTSMFVVYNQKVLLVPSKAKHKNENQFDPPSCSTCFISEDERFQYISGLINTGRYSKKEFKKYFYIISTPIKFSHKDDLCEKLFTAYVVLMNDKAIVKEFLIDKNEQWLKISDIVSGTTPHFISPLFTKATKALLEEKKYALERNSRYFL
jgi:hypothetical protein